MQKDLKAMINEGIFEKTASRWTSPLVIVRKPSGDLRICVDRRKLNEHTEITSYALPNIIEALERLADTSYFTTVYMFSGLHQIKVHQTAEIRPRSSTAECRLD